MATEDSKWWRSRKKEREEGKGEDGGNGEEGERGKVAILATYGRLRGVCALRHYAIG